ncbi:MAG: hypothetical protein AAF383_02900 [Cyanobacteria bacterium P01_A01_bin.83]
MITGKPPITTDIAALDSTASDIWKRLTIIRTEAWFSTVSEIAREYQVTAKLESRYRKSAIICDVDGCRIGRVWQLDENMPIFYDIRQWISHYESTNTISEAVNKIASKNN